MSTGKSGARVNLSQSCFLNTQDSVQQLYGDINFNTFTAKQLKGRGIQSITTDDFLELNSKVFIHFPGTRCGWIELGYFLILHMTLIPSLINMLSKFRRRQIPTHLTSWWPSTSLLIPNEARILSWVTVCCSLKESDHWAR